MYKGGGIIKQAVTKLDHHTSEGKISMTVN